MNETVKELPADEAEHLASTQKLIRKELLEASREVLRKSSEFPDLLEEYNAYGVQHRSAELSAYEAAGLQDADFGRVMETAGFLTFLYDKQSVLRHTMKNAAVLHRLQKNPYFGRFDFKNEGETADRIYLGRHGLTDPDTHEIHIYDWRSPVASVFYRYGRGPAGYDAPVGRIDGEVTLKRQYKFHRGRLQYFFDIDMQISDDMLAYTLAQNTSGRMRDIVETIQREQDTAIRDSENGLLMIQGAAGSGKTSIALHRTAYLLYEKSREGLRSQDILLLTPNAMFGRYISDVLPELGEENIVYADFEDIYNQAIAGEKLFDTGEKEQKDPTNERYQQEYYEAIHEERLQAEQAQEQQRRSRMLNGARESMLEGIATAGPEEAELMRQSAAFKGSEAFAELLRRFVRSRENGRVFEDITLCGRVIYSGEEMRSEFLDNKIRRPAAKRMSRIAGRVRIAARERRKELYAELVQQLKTSKDGYPDVAAEARRIIAAEHKRLEQYLTGLCSMDAREAYLGLFSDSSLFYRLAGSLSLPPRIEEIIRRTAERQPSFEDAAGILFLHAELSGASGFDNIRQVLVDEAQDYYPLQYEVLRLYFPAAQFTVMGDAAQSLERSVDLSLYDLVRRILNKKKSALITFTKSYRSTREITEYASALLPDSGAQPFERHGEPVRRVEGACDGLLLSLKEDIDALRQQNYESVAVLCRSLKAAEALHPSLGAETRLIGSSLGEAPEKGVSVMPVYLSKGLEFDAVLVWDPDGRSFEDEEGRRHLYVACTRALHVLRLYSGTTQSTVLQ